MSLKETQYEDVVWIHLAQDKTNGEFL